MDDYARQLKKLDEEVEAKLDEIRDRADAVVEHKFCGWNIYHRFRCTDRLGMQQICDALIVVDENMEYVYGCLMLDDDNDYCFEKSMEIIDKAIGKDRK